MLRKKGKKQREKAAPPSLKRRVVRFFISSTFKDMQEERDVLIRKVFPRLQQQFRWSGVEIIPIDLRWGVTREQAENGAVLPICLAEIDQCQPYFIGLLGERYGWIPERIPQELLAAYPWLGKYRDRSLTELEIIHGVLNDPGNRDRAFFFFREPGDPPGKQAANDEGPLERAKLQDLKDRIFDAGCECADYRGVDDLALQAHEILEAALSDEFPEPEPGDPFAQEARAHRIHGQSFETVHVERQELVRRLDDYVERGGAPLMVLGGTGSGKTALLSNYFRRHQEAHPDDFVLLHFMGILQQNSIAGFVYRVAGELQKRFGLKGTPPRTDEQAVLALPRWLEEAGAKGRVLLLVDDVDQLGYRTQRKNFSWIPAGLPANVRLVCTAKPENAPEAVTGGAAGAIHLPPLAKEEREQIIASHFKVYGKKLEPQYVSALAAAPQTALPLFLTLALNELRVYGYFEKLDEHISHLLTSEHLIDLYHKVLGRFEQDFCGHRPDIVKDFMSLVYHSRHGLSEEDLEYSLKLDKADALFTWHGLLLAAGGIMKARRGRLFIGDKFLENAIWEQYIKGSPQAEHYHQLLAECFTKEQMLASDMSELFWHLFSLKDWQRLHDILADLEFIRSEVRGHVLADEIMGYWLVLEKLSGFRIATTYKEVLDHPGRDPELHGFVHSLLNDPVLRDVGVHFVQGLTKMPDPLFRNQFDLDPGITITKNKDGTTTIESIGADKHSVAHAFLQEMQEHSNLGLQAYNLLNRGDLKGAMDTATLLMQLCRKRGDKMNLVTSLIVQAAVVRMQGSPDAALPLLAEAEQACKEGHNRLSLHLVYGEQGLAFKAMNQPDKAMDLFREKEEFCRKSGNKEGIRFSLEMRADIESARQRWPEALELLGQMEELCRELNDPVGQQLALERRGIIRFNMGDVDGAAGLWKAQEGILRLLNDPQRLQIVLGNLGLAWEARKNAPEAMKKYQEQEALCRQHRILPGLQYSLDKQANLHFAARQHDRAAALWQEQEAVCRELRDMAKVQCAVGNRGLAALARNAPDDALKLFQEQERICREIGYKPGLRFALEKQAEIEFGRRRWPEALELFRGMEAVCREIDDPAGLQLALGRQGNIHFSCNRADEAFSSWTEQEKILRGFNDPNNLQITLGNLGAVWEARKNAPEALKKYREQEAVCRQHHIPFGLQFALDRQAMILLAAKQYDQAVVLWLEQEKICRELGDMAKAQCAVGNQGRVHYEQNDPAAALPFFREQERICRELKDDNFLSICLFNQALSLHKLNEPAQALPLLEEAQRLFARISNAPMNGRALQLLPVIRKAAAASAT